MPYKDYQKTLAAARASNKRRWNAMTKEERRAWSARRTPLQRRREHLKARYGLTLEQWEAEFDAQGRKCQICCASTSGWKRGWHTDHDHKTGRMRGILCHSCNRTLGHVKDEVGHLQAFIGYLEFYA